MKSRLMQLALGLPALTSASLTMAHGDHPVASGVSHSLLHAAGSWENLLVLFAVASLAAISFPLWRRHRQSARIIKSNSRRS